MYLLKQNDEDKVSKTRYVLFYGKFCAPYESYDELDKDVHIWYVLVLVLWFLLLIEILVIVLYEVKG